MTREEAKAILEEEAEFLYGNDKPHNRIAFDMAISALSEKKGEWIWNKPTNPISYCKCSACNSGCWEMEFNYCPNCGADMRGDT